MEELKPRIEMYAKRPFGDKMNASFDFIKENWKPLLKYTTYLLLPLSLIQGLSLNGFMGNYLSATTEIQQAGLDSILPLLPALGVSYSLMILCTWLGIMLLGALTYSLMKTYSQREGRLQGITLSELKPMLTRNLVQMLKGSLSVGLLMLILMTVLILLVVLTPFTLLLTMPLLFAVGVPLALFFPIYLFESITLIEAFKKTFRLGFATWGGVFLISLVMSLIASILQGVVGTPWTVALMIKQVFSMSDTADVAGTLTTGYSFMLYLFAILHCFGTYVSTIFLNVSLAYQYGHASEVVDSVSVESDIDNFDKL